VDETAGGLYLWMLAGLLGAWGLVLITAGLVQKKRRREDRRMREFLGDEDDEEE